MQADWKESEKAPRVIDKLRGEDGRLEDGLKGNDKGKSDCINAVDGRSYQIQGVWWVLIAG